MQSRPMPLHTWWQMVGPEGTLGFRATRGVLEHALASGLGQRIALQVKVLVVRGDVGVANQHTIPGCAMKIQYSRTLKDGS
ncbi:hypothetical protein PTE30175_03658 [Pandoraea terrae]|uniref:Uncharacterized protein n=1 Tax=Pandoraea terrae TaxID=1537710 RepID=A0A5E4XA51_9BURK|nr:hypothetical protein PTE30175_03658 [Pandoraea terrae]